MKTIHLILALAFSSFMLAQEAYTESLSGIKTVQLQINTQVHVVSGSGNQLSITDGIQCDDCEEDESNSQYYYNDDGGEGTKEDERAKGLTPLYAGGTDNTGFGFMTERDGGVLKIKDLKSWTQRSGFTLTLPKGINLKLDTGNLGSAKIEGIDSELELSSNVGNLTLINVTGPITADSSTGTIEVIFDKVNQSSPISISTATGTIDVSLPTNTPANVELRSTMGSVYSNFDLEEPREDGMKVVGSNRNIEGQLNNGGVDIKLKSSTGNIYLRKKA